MIKIVFLGKLKDVSGQAEFNIAAPQTLLGYLENLATAQPDLHEALTATGIRCALNLKLIANGQDCNLQDGDELAFMPPVSGG
jgi:molybdopterin converting factor small subunit